MKLSTESRYAISGLSVLVDRPPGAIVELAQIAEEAGLPAPFLAKIFLKLTRRGILTSHRGRERGYSLAASPARLEMIDILEAVDGDDLFDRCVFWSATCDDGIHCPLHEAWAPVKAKIRSTMESTTLDDL